MTAMHFHLLLNHAPLFGSLFGLILLALAWVRHSEELKRVGLGCLVLTALLAVPAFLTGEPAEKAVSGLAGVSKGIIERHEAAATVAFIGLSALGALALVFLLVGWRKATIPRWMGATALAGTLLVSGLMAWTANLGGQVRHTEIRRPAAATSEGADVNGH